MRNPHWLTIVLLAALPASLLALDEVSLKRDGATVRVQGRIVTEAVDGGLLVLDREGVLWMVQPD